MQKSSVVCAWHLCTRSLDQMLCQNHHAEPYPQRVEADKRGQQFLVTGPYQHGTGQQAGEIQLPDLHAKYQPGHYDHGLGYPRHGLHYVVVGPVLSVQPHAITLGYPAPPYVVVYHCHYDHGCDCGEQDLC